MVLFVDAMEIRSSLQAAHVSMAEVRSGLVDVDVAGVADALEDADQELATARSRSSGVVWWAASYVPSVRHSTTLREVVEVAGAAVELGLVAVDDGRDRLVRGLDDGVQDGHVHLAPLLAARDLIDELPVDRLVNAHEQLEASRAGWIPDVLRDGRAETLLLSDAAIATVTGARDANTVLPRFLGVDETRRYFVVMETSVQLRGTGT